MKHKIFINKEKTLELVVDGNLSGEELSGILDRFESYANDRKSQRKPANIIVETTHLGRATPENRKEALSRLKALPVHKMAVYGSHNPYAKYITRLAAKALGLPTMQFFDSRKEAEAWLGTND